MAKCKYCGKSGLFLSVNQFGLCSSCNNLVVLTAQGKVRVIEDSRKLIMNSKNLDTKLSRSDLIIQLANTLLEYEEKDINIFSKKPSELIRQIKAEKNEIIINALSDEYNKTISKVELLTTSSSKINELNKLLIKLQEYKDVPDEKINKMMFDIRNKRHEIQLDVFIDNAKKAEFKNDKKKALDQYQEALYFLKNDDIDDKFQKENIKNIEDKIQELKS